MKQTWTHYPMMNQSLSPACHHEPVNINDSHWNDHRFWNLAVSVSWRSRASLTNRKSFWNTVLPRKNNSGTKSVLSNYVYGQSKETHLFYITLYWFWNTCVFFDVGQAHLRFVKQELTTNTETSNNGTTIHNYFDLIWNFLPAFCATVLKIANENQVSKRSLMINIAKLHGRSFLKVIFVNRNRCVIS